MQSPIYRVGDQVSIVRGQLAGLTGVVLRFTAADRRCLLEIDRLAAGFRVLIHSDYIQKIGEPPQVDVQHRSANVHAGAGYL